MIIMYSAHHATAQNADDWYGTYSFTLPKPSSDTLFNNDEDMEFIPEIGQRMLFGLKLFREGHFQLNRIHCIVKIPYSVIR